MSQPKLPVCHKATSDFIVAYRNLTERRISELFQNELKDSKSIDKFVHDLSRILLSSCAESSVPFSSYNTYTRPEWTKTVKHLYTAERAKRKIWMSEGRPRRMQFTSYR